MSQVLVTTDQGERLLRAGCSGSPQEHRSAPLARTPLARPLPEPLDWTWWGELTLCTGGLANR